MLCLGTVHRYCTPIHKSWWPCSSPCGQNIQFCAGGLCIDITHHTTNPGEMSLSQLCKIHRAALVAVAFLWHTNPQILVALVFAVLPALTMMSWVPVKLIGHTNPQILVACFLAMLTTHNAVLGACALIRHTNQRHLVALIFAMLQTQGVLCRGPGH